MPKHLTRIETVTSLPDPGLYEPGYPVIHEGLIKVVSDTATPVWEAVSSEPNPDANRGVGLGATADDPTFTGLAAGFESFVRGSYSGGVLLGAGGEMVMGPNNWQDGVAIGSVVGSGEAIAIGMDVEAIQAASIYIADYPSGIPSQGDIVLGGYVSTGNYDDDNNPDFLTPPAVVTPPTFTPDGGANWPTEMNQLDFGFVIRNAGHWTNGVTTGHGGGFAGNLVTIEGALNNTIGEVTQAYIRFRGVWDLSDGNGTFFGGWQYIQLGSVTDPLTYQFDGTELTVPTDFNDRSGEPFPFAKPYYTAGVDTSRVLVGYSASMTNPAIEGVSVGALNNLDHNRAILIGPNLSSARDYEVKVGGDAHVHKVAGGVEFRTLTVTAAHTIDGDGLAGTNKETVVLADATSAVFDVTLPAAASGRTVVIKKIDASANAVGIVTPGAETIDGAASDSLATQYDTIRLVSDGTNWFII